MASTHGYGYVFVTRSRGTEWGGVSRKMWYYHGKWVLIMQKYCRNRDTDYMVVVTGYSMMLNAFLF